MAFNVGAIVSKLTLDKSGWNQSVKAVGEDQKKMQGMSEKTAAKFKKVGAAMTVAGGAIIGALAGMTRAFANAGDEIDKMSRRTGIGSVALSELKHAAELSGASLGDVEKGVKRMSGTILDAHAGLETYIRSFRQMGISIDDLMKMNPEQQFISISEAIAKIEDPTIRAALAQDVFGRAGTALLPMFDKGAEGLREMRERAHDLGIVFSEDAAKAAAELVDAQLELKMSLKGVGLTIVKDLAPHITEFIKKMTATVEKVITWIKENPKLTMTIVKIAAGIGGLLVVLGPIVMLIPKLVIGAKMLAGGFTALLSPAGLLIAALAAIAIGYFKVKQAQAEAEKSSKRLAEQESKLWEKLKKTGEAAGLSAREMEKLIGKYGGNIRALTMSIKRGEESLELQKALAEVSGEQKEEIDKQREATDGLGFSMGDLTGRFQGYLDELTKTKEETKTWVDYLKDMGVKTLKEKGDRVTELTTYLGQLDDAYAKGLISLKDYVESTNAAKKEVEELSTEITTTAIPASRDMASVYDQAVTEMTVTTGDFTTSIKTETEKQRTIWSDLFTSIGDDIKSNLTNWLAGHQSFGNAVGNVWDNLKTKFIGTLVEMGTSWTTDFIGGMLSSAKSGFGSVVDTVKNLGKGVVDTIKGFSPAGIAQGVITGAVSGLVSGIVGGKGGLDSTDKFHLKNIWVNSGALKPIEGAQDATRDHVLRIAVQTEGVPKKLDISNRHLDQIVKNTDPIKNMVSAQKGAVITQPTLAALHGSSADPEIVSPVSKLVEGLKGFGGASASLSQNINVNIMVKDQLDPYVAERITREQIVPNMLKAIDVDSKNKTRMRNILGIQV